MISGGFATVNYEAAGPLLPVPEPTDDLETTTRKIKALAEGHSLAVRTGFSKAAHKERDPVAIAIRSMTPQQLLQYNAWDDGATMPDIDWAACHKPVPGGAASLKRFTRRAEAMRIIWESEDINAENASWLTFEMPYALPLVTAVARVNAVRRDLVGGQSELSALEMAEAQTVRKVVAIAKDNVDRAFQRFYVLSRDINSAKEILQARENALRSKMAASFVCTK